MLRCGLSVACTPRLIPDERRILQEFGRQVAAPVSESDCHIERYHMTLLNGGESGRNECVGGKLVCSCCLALLLPRHKPSVIFC